MEPNNQNGSTGAALFRRFLLSEESASFREALLDIRLALNLATAIGTNIDPRDHAESARTVADTISQWAEVGEVDWAGATEWVSPEQPEGLDVLAYRARAGELLAFGAFLMTAGGGDPEQLATDITRIAFGVDPHSVLMGDYVGDPPLDIDPTKLPPDLDRIQEFLERTCVGGLLHAAARFGQVASNRPHTMVGAQITEVDPDHGCVDDEVVIHGMGFGARQLGHVTVMFTAQNGGCVPAQVVSWSETEITVKVPPNVGHGCVGLAEHPSGFEGIVEAAEQFAGELETCLGSMAVPAGDRIRGSAIKVAAAACPTCDDPHTRFAGGPPVVKSFTANGRTVAEIRPGGDITVAWDVEGAEEVHIESVLSVLPPLPEPFDPHAGSTKVDDIDLVDGTVGSWELAATNQCGTTKVTIDVVILGRKALIFSGGGAKGAFEVGTVLCLRHTAGVEFDIISGASVGALNAAKLAEDHHGPALAELEALWLGMQGPSDFYLERQWFQVLEPTIKSLFRTGSSNLGFEAGRMVASYASDKMLGALASAMGIPGLVYSIFTSLYPVTTGIIDLVRYYNAVKQALAAPSLFLFTPTENKINASIDPAKIAASGIELRITVVGLETGEALVIDQEGIMVDSGVRVPLRDAIRASASIPIAFPPVPLQGPHGTEQFVDGGVREITPVAQAVEAGAHRVYVVLLNPIRVDRAVGFSQPTMIKIAGRSVDMILDEAQRNDFSPPGLGFGVPTTVIAPTFLVHDTLFVDPGTISINMDYGYMRAYDEVVADPVDRMDMRQLSDEITATRLEIWAAEHWANGRLLAWLPRGQLVAAADPVALQNVRDLKRIVRTKVYQRIGASAPESVPANRAVWWQEWERHPWQPLNPSPWDRLISNLGTLNAVPRPPA